MTDLPGLRVCGWQHLPGLRHGFLGRCGGPGFSGGTDLNLSADSADDPVLVAENRRRVEASLPGESRLVWMQQVHGERVVPVLSKSAEVGPADGMVTREPGAILAVLTADCVPILLVARRRKVAGVVHAGWRGTVAGIVRRAVDLISVTYGVEAHELEAALGPAIGGCCYEVDRDIGERFMERWGPLAASGWRSYDNKGKLDLRVANEHLLRQAGLPATQIHRLGPCTCCAAEEYFSYRRSGAPAGRQLSYIGWAD